MILTLSPTNHTPGSCKNSLLWGDLIWLCRMSTEEEEEDSELEEVRGGLGPSLTPSPGLPFTNPLVSTGTLDRHAGDLILSVSNLCPLLFCATPCGSGQFLLEYNKESELRYLLVFAGGWESGVGGRGPASHWGLRRTEWGTATGPSTDQPLKSHGPLRAWETHTLHTEPTHLRCPA